MDGICLSEQFSQTNVSYFVCIWNSLLSAPQLGSDSTYNHNNHDKIDSFDFGTILIHY